MVHTNSTSSALDLQDKSFFIEGANSLSVKADNEYDGLSSVTISSSALEGYFAVHVFNCGDKNGYVTYFGSSECCYTSCSKGESETIYVKKGALILCSADVVNYKNADPFSPYFLNTDTFITNEEQNILLTVNEECWITLYQGSGNYVEAPEEFLPFDNC